MKDRWQIGGDKRLSPRQQQVQHGPHREDVGALVNRDATGLFWRHEVGSPDDVPAGGHVRAGQPRDAEIQDLDATIRLQEQVAWLDVPVADSRRARHGQTVADFEHEADLLFDRQWPSLEPLGQRLPLQQLHDDEEASGLVFIDVVDGHDVGVGEPGAHLRLARESGADLGFTLEVRHQDLHSDIAAHHVIVRGIHDAHGALADALDDL